MQREILSDNKFAADETGPQTRTLDGFAINDIGPSGYNFLVWILTPPWSNGS